jgi:hypothetical protein
MTIQKPQIKTLGGVYQLTFMDERIQVKVERVRENTQRETWGELTVTSTIPEDSGHIHQARLNMTASAPRKTMAKSLEDRISSLDWGGILEYVCVMVLQAHREGAPVIQLAEHEMPKGLSHRLFPYIQERQASLLFGEGDTGKSWLAIMMAVSVSTGMPMLNMRPERGNVLYLDYETDEDTLWERVNMICAGLGKPIPDGFYYRQMHQLLSADFQHINQLVVDNGISLVIVDSAAPAVGEPEASQPTTEYFRVLHSLRVSTLTVAHVAKGGKENEPFGSIFWRNLPRANFRVTASHEPGADEFVVGIRHTKSNNGRRMKDLAYRLDFQEGSLTFAETEVMDVPDLADNQPLYQKIAVLVKRGAMGTDDLAGELGVRAVVVASTLARHTERFQPVDGKWGLRAQER